VIILGAIQAGSSGYSYTPNDLIEFRLKYIYNLNYTSNLAEAGTLYLYDYIESLGAYGLLASSTFTLQDNLQPGNLGGDTLTSSPSVADSITYSTGNQYNFNLLPQHYIPPGGCILVTFPEEISINSGSCSDLPDYIDNCDFDGDTVTLTLSSDDDAGYDVAIIELTGSVGISFTIGGIRNSRTTTESSLFAYNSYYTCSQDSTDQIDQSVFLTQTYTV
jgi:hypothetical protein